MSWVTFIWSITAGICLSLGAVHFLVWTRRRDEWANLVFSITAAAAAGYAVLDMMALHVQSPTEYGDLWRWALALGMLEGVLIVWFIRLYLRAGRLWLLWMICGLRVLMLVLNFASGTNFYFREITGLEQLPLLGELISRPHGVLHPWVILMPVSFLLIIIFAIDAAHAASRRSGRSREWMTGGLFALGFSLALVSYALYARGILPSTFSSQILLLLILLMGYELSLDVLRVGELNRSLHLSEERMSLAAEAANLGIWSREITRDEIWASARWREMFGFTESERIDFDQFMQRLHSDDREPVRRTISKLARDTRSYDIEYRIILPDGQIRWIGSHGGVETSVEGRLLRLRGVSVDITARKQLEVETQRQRTELAHVARVSMMGQLASALAHELNQPLGAILRNAEAAQILLQSDPPDLDEIRAILADICEDDARAGAIIDHARNMMKQRDLEISILAVDELVEGVVALTHSDAATRHVNVQVDLAPRIPAICGDRVRLQQVLINLMLNGMDAMMDVPAAGRQLAVRARQIDDKTVVFEVSDSGSGIAADHFSHVFDSFFTTKRNGLGMGLTISRTIIEEHGGQLTAENNPGRGATFRFTVPVAAEGPRP